MILTPIRTNMTQLDIADTKILFSYKTPVACAIYSNGRWIWYKTEKKWSNTTSRHVSEWLRNGFDKVRDKIEIKPQEFFDNLVAGVK